MTLFYTHLAKQDADGVPVDNMLLVHSKSTQEIGEEYAVINPRGPSAPAGGQPPTYFGFFRPRPTGRVCSCACGFSDAKSTIIITIILGRAFPVT